MHTRVKRRFMHRYAYGALAVTLLVLLLIGSAQQRAVASTTVQLQDPPEEVTLENGYRITFLEVLNDEGTDTSTWRYRVEELPEAKDLSNWVLELPTCINIVDATPEPWEAVHPDPNALLTGIKWETGDGFEDEEFEVTVEGQWGTGETDVAAKGPDVAWGVIAGPVCEEENQAPMIVDDTVSTYAGWPITIPVLRNDFDPDGDILFLEAFDNPSTGGGSVTRDEQGTMGDFSDDYLVYTSTVGFEGDDTFGYTAGDGNLSDQATVTVTVLMTDTAPIANPDTFMVRETPFEVPAPGILLNDQLLDYTEVDIILVDEPVSGTLTMPADMDGSFAYTPDAEFFGEDTFTYYLEAQGVTSTVTSTVATVTLNVLDEVDPTVEWVQPVPEGETRTIEAGDVVQLEVKATDNKSIDHVRFFRWDEPTEEYVTIAEVADGPYVSKVSASELQLGFNQIFTYVDDKSGNRSDIKDILLYKVGNFRLYLPITTR